MTYRHGLAKKVPEYKIWQNIRQRIGNPNNKSFEHYGGRGIEICARWTDFAAFYLDMGPRPTPKHTIDRIDVNGNYEPSNCRWATWSQQMRNRTDNHWVIVDGERMIISDAAKRSGKRPGNLFQLLKHGHSIDAAILPMRRSSTHLSGAAREELRERLEAGESQAAIMRSFGVSNRYLAKLLGTPWANSTRPIRRTPA